MKLHHFRPKKEKRGLLYQVFILVAVLQISLLIGLSGYIVSQSIIEDEQRLDAPPPVEKVQVAQKEHRVRVERQQKKSRKMNKRIQVANPQNVNAPEVKVTIPASISTGAGYFYRPCFAFSSRSLLRMLATIYASACCSSTSYLFPSYKLK